MRKDIKNLEKATIEETIRSINQLADSIKSMIKTIKNLDIDKIISQGIESIVETFRNLPEACRESWVLAARQGWYVNWYTPFPIVSKINNSTQIDLKLNHLMLEHLKGDFESISSEIMAACPERREILECAFNLLKDNNYIASIPLLLAQIDGICADIIGTNFFTDKEKRPEKIEEFKSTQDHLVSVLLDLLTLNTQFSAGIRCSSSQKKLLAPNRHGIMHGSRKHLDYGTETNGYKTFSLLAFIVFVLVKPNWGGNA